MAPEPNQESTAVAVRGFLIWAEEFSKKRRYGAAEKLYQRALVFAERTLGRSHPMTAEVLECYADLLVKTDRRTEAIVMKNRAEEVWKAYVPRYCRTIRGVQPLRVFSQEREGSD